MQNLLLTIPTKTKLLMLALVGIIIITTIIIALQTSPTNKDSSIKQSSQSNTNDTVIGKKITPEVENKLNIISKEASSEGTTIYSLGSENTIRTDQLITKNDQIIFQRTYIPESPNDPNHFLISQALQKYGEPEKIIKGSKLWGPFMQTYIYNSKGVAFIGNPNTDEVYELQNFTPLSLEEYLQKYGDDIDETPPQGES